MQLADVENFITDSKKADNEASIDIFEANPVNQIKESRFQTKAKCQEAQISHQKPISGERVKHIDGEPGMFIFVRVYSLQSR